MLRPAVGGRRSAWRLRRCVSFAGLAHRPAPHLGFCLLGQGLSEPVGALIALVFIKPYLTPLRLHLMLAFVGGVMSAVCWIELLPEGRRCKHDGALLRGTLLGAGLMAITLAYV